MKCKVLFLFAVAINYSTVFCQQITKRLDSFVNVLTQYREINGNILVAQNGLPVYKRSIGYADIQNKLLNNDSSAFALASVSKVFTSAAVLQLRDKGKLKLGDVLIKYFADFPFKNITIKQLLSHTSGLPDYNLYQAEIEKDPTKIFTNADVIPSLKKWKKPLPFEPGSKWSYSNTNYCLLALLVEKVSGMRFEKYVRKYIFVPAKMMNTHFQSDTSDNDFKKRVVNYEYPLYYDAEYQNVDSIKRYHWRLYNASGFVGQGNIFITAGDLLKFDNALYEGKIVKPSSLEEAFTPVKTNIGEYTHANLGDNKASYGLGWFIFTDSTGEKVVWHTGGQPGGLSIFIRNISKKQTVILFDNEFHKSLYANGVSILSILENKPVIFYKRSVAQEYGAALSTGSRDAAYCKLVELRADSAHYYVSEDELNDLGLQLLYAATFAGHDEAAMEVLKINTLLFPKSFNTYDSYGEALARLHKKPEAIFMYKKSIELNPGNEGGKKALEDLRK